MGWEKRKEEKDEERGGEGRHHSYSETLAFLTMSKMSWNKE